MLLSNLFRKFWRGYLLAPESCIVEYKCIWLIYSFTSKMQMNHKYKTVLALYCKDICPGHLTFLLW